MLVQMPWPRCKAFSRWQQRLAEFRCAAGAAPVHRAGRQHGGGEPEAEVSCCCLAVCRSGSPVGLFTDCKIVASMRSGRRGQRKPLWWSVERLPGVLATRLFAATGDARTHWLFNTHLLLSFINRTPRYTSGGAGQTPRYRYSAVKQSCHITAQRIGLRAS